jgi:serine/threonine protein kinase
MVKLGELYTDFFRVDLDARGGYARVADVVAHQEDKTLVHRAFKLMRHELDRKQVGLQRFENELKILVEISQDKDAPPAITRIYDSGFVEVSLSENLHTLQTEGVVLGQTPSSEIISTGIDVQKFLDTEAVLMAEETDRWLPYLVVELAPYHDSLLRQIQLQSVGVPNTSTVLPVNSVVEMSLQLLDVMEYLHTKLRYAYVDWKPEHIYWNVSLRQLKLIDWNVTNQLAGNPRERNITREDVRMFFGAALYCGLALTDPEDPRTPIGPEPKVTLSLTPPIRPRYWTDKPNFYQRDGELDENIKLLVQKGLDPSQGFGSPQEAKDALILYVEQGDKQDDNEQVTKLPSEAVQRYRQARSYIAARDYSFAILALEVSIALASSVGVSYPDAEELLVSVQNIMKVDEFKQGVKLALENKHWDDAINLYDQAILLDPANLVIKKECDSLKQLLGLEVKVQRMGMLKAFISTRKLKTALNVVKSVAGSDSPILSFVKWQLQEVAQLRIAGVIVLLLFGFLYFTLRATATPIYILTPSFTPALTVSPTYMVAPSFTLSPAVSPTYTVTPSLAPTTTLTSKPTIAPLAYGKLLSTYFRPYDEPNKNIMDNAIERNQPLVIVSTQESYGALWYECVWERDGVTSRGWILAEKIKIVRPPTATATP